MIPRILSVIQRSDVIHELRSIKVDEYGIRIMAPKADSFLIKIGRVSSIAANILKQEMLSLGGDVAISRQSITGKDKYTPCLLIGNHTQFDRLIQKLYKQPFKLDCIGKNLNDVIVDYSKHNYSIRCRNRSLKTGARTLIMGIMNLTTDSFSGDGLLSSNTHVGGQEFERVIKERMEQIEQEGADIIDIGAESSRPGAQPLNEAEEVRRISMCLKIIRKRCKLPISIDTYKPEVARAALDLGAHIINDITGLRNPKMRKVVARFRAGAVLMHMKGMPRTMQRNPTYKSIIDELFAFFKKSIDAALKQGIAKESLIIDPGIGFGKTVGHTIEILRRLREFRALGQPILVGVSRKSFIGKIINADVGARQYGSAAAAAVAINHGADIVRVHDVTQTRDVARICDAVQRI